MPLGSSRWGQRLVRVRKRAGKPVIEEVADVIFVPMTGAIQEKSRR